MSKITITLTHEGICDFIKGYEKRNGKVSDEYWWLIYEYLDWKYNNGRICSPTLRERSRDAK